jgi:hypothetical protein
MPFRRTLILSAIMAVLITLPLSAQWPMMEKRVQANDMTRNAVTSPRW